MKRQKQNAVRTLLEIPRGTDRAAGRWGKKPG